jgi:hypothetical protein
MQTILAGDSQNFNDAVMPSLIDCAMCAEPESTDATGILQIFDEAISHKLRWPRIRLLASDGSTLVLRRAGEKSKRPGVIHLTDGTFLSVTPLLGEHLAERYAVRVTPDDASDSGVACRLQRRPSPSCHQASQTERSLLLLPSQAERSALAGSRSWREVRYELWIALECASLNRRILRKRACFRGERCP